MIPQQIKDFYKNEMEEGWYHFLLPFLESPQMEKIRTTIIQRRRVVNVFPKKEDIFTAFKYPLKDVRVIILGQDCYYTKGHAHGLAFSSIHEKICPPSLRNILAEVENDCNNNVDYDDWCLDRWAIQGVLLLNTALTVEENTPESHIKLWKSFTEYLLFNLCKNNTGLIFLLWGTHARSYKRLIGNTHNILEAAHPSPLSAHKGFFGCKHFSQTNKILEGINGKNHKIIW